MIFFYKLFFALMLFTALPWVTLGDNQFISPNVNKERVTLVVADKAIADVTPLLNLLKAINEKSPGSYLFLNHDSTQSDETLLQSIKDFKIKFHKLIFIGFEDSTMLQALSKARNDLFFEELFLTLPKNQQQEASNQRLPQRLSDKINANIEKILPENTIELGRFKPYQQSYQRNFSDTTLLNRLCYDLSSFLPQNRSEEGIKFIQQNKNFQVQYLSLAQQPEKKYLEEQTTFCLIEVQDHLLKKKRPLFIRYSIKSHEITIAPDEFFINFAEEVPILKKITLNVELKQPLRFQIRVNSVTDPTAQQAQPQEATFFYSTDKLTLNSSSNSYLLPAGTHSLVVGLVASRHLQANYDMQFWHRGQLLNKVKISVNQGGFWLKTWLMSVSFVKEGYQLMIQKFSWLLWSLLIVLVLIIITVVLFKILRQKKVKLALSQTQERVIDFTKVIYKEEKCVITAQKNPFGLYLPHFTHKINISIDAENIVVLKNKAAIAISYQESMRQIHLDDIWDLDIEPKQFSDDNGLVNAAQIRLRKKSASEVG